jgi:hypothetical protein
VCKKGSPEKPGKICSVYTNLALWHTVDFFSSLR